MDTAGTFSVQLPAQLYADLRILADDEQLDPTEVIARLVAAARQQRSWRHGLQLLREQIIKDGGLQIGTTKDDVVARLRQTRRKIFEAEYAHLY